MPEMKFERHEKKYTLLKSEAKQLIRALQPYIEKDEYYQYTICSLYFDSPNFALARREQEKPRFKEKLRLRSYGAPGMDDIVFLELKKKLDGVTYKRRMPLRMREAKAYIKAGIHPAGAAQIFSEIDWFARKTCAVPKTLICYDRTAFHGKRDPALRITFDESIRWRNGDLDLMLGDAGRLLCPPGEVMMEIKVPDAMPLYLASALAEAGAFPAPFSKYGAVYNNIFWSCQ